MNAGRGGRELSTAQMASGLAEMGHEVTVVCQDGDVPSDKVRLEKLGRRGVFRLQRLNAFLSDAQDALSTGAYDVVHTTLPMRVANVYQPRGGTIPGQIDASTRRWGLAGGLRRHVFEKLNVCRAKLGQLEREIAGDPNVRCLAVSRMVAEEFSRYYGRANGVTVVYNGVDLPVIDDEDWKHWRQQHRYDLGVGRNDTVFISVAGNFALKGVDQLVRHYAKWRNKLGRDKNARLIVVGKDVTEGYQRTANIHNVGREVLFVPPTKNIFEWYAAADACVLLSWYDPCSRTVLEAVRCGIPAVTTVYNGAAEVLAEGAGLVVDGPDDAVGVIAALDELSDVARRAEYAAACEAAADSVSMAEHVAGLDRVYREVAGR